MGLPSEMWADNRKEPSTTSQRFFGRRALNALRLGTFEAPRPECLVSVGAPWRKHSASDHLVTEPGQTVFGVRFEGELQELVSLAASAFPPIDVSDGGQQSC